VSGAPQRDWATVRRDYPALKSRAYLDTACMGIPSSRAARAVTDHVAMLREAQGPSTTDQTVRMLDQFARARRAVAALIGAAPDEIALVPSTESGIAALAAAVTYEPHANIVASDIEFIGSVLPWHSLNRTRVEVKLVAHRDGRIDLGDLDAAIDSRTRAVVVSSVQEVNGFRIDLDELSRLCRSRSVLLIVDAIQHVGPLTLDVGVTNVDAVAVGGHKWLCAPFGMGFLYTSRRLLEELRPPMRAFMTALPPKQGWSRYLESPDRRPDDELEFPTDARKLEAGALGTTLAATGLASALETLLELGPEAIAARSKELVALTTVALEDAGAEVVTPAGQLPSSIVTFRSAKDVDGELQVVEALADAGVLSSLRFTTGVGGIRVSPYFYNDETDIDRLAETVRKFGARRRGGVKVGPVNPRLT
jgi:cysteine desulfurase / selenocysteine lyase